MNVQEIEKKIVSKIIDEALAKGYTITINNGGDDNEITRSNDKEAILENMFATDEEKMIFSGVASSQEFGWVYLVYGNDGYDVINDYILNPTIEVIMAPVEKYIQELEKEAV